MREPASVLRRTSGLSSVGAAVAPRRRRRIGVSEKASIVDTGNLMVFVCGSEQAGSQ
jgi:hypothetical protein